MDRDTPTLNLAEVLVIIVRPNDDEPGILCFHTGGVRRLYVFSSDAECDEACASIERELHNFVHFHSMFFQPAELKSLDKCDTPEYGHHLHFIFHSGGTIRQQYEDEQTLDDDLNTVNNILGTLQDIRASKHTSPTKQ
jgi:hypothetical protein